MKCEFVSDAQIKVSGVVVSDLKEASELKIVITNFFINVVEPIQTSSWHLVSYTEGGHFVDEIDSGLSLKFDCYAPCETCK